MRRTLKLIAASVTLMMVATMALAQAQYKVRTGDVLSIEVLEDSSLNRSVEVLPDGRFNFPFAGTMQAAGLSAEQIQSSIQSGIQSNFAAPPTVFVSVQPAQRATPTGRSSRAMEVYMLGEVNNPGTVSIRPGTTLLQAMAIGGGVSRFAAIKRIQVRRTDASGVQNVFTINYKALANGVVGNDIELRDGDVILVPERRLFE